MSIKFNNYLNFHKNNYLEILHQATVKLATSVFTSV